jgi:hypothetical protein
MTKGLPDVCGHEKTTLYIIGNGFDLAHGILSKYKHFFCWLNLNGYEDYANRLQKMFPKLDNRVDFLWSNFENALEIYDLHDIYKQYVPFPDRNCSEEWNKNIQLGAKQVKKMIDNIPLLMKEWAENIMTNLKPVFTGLSSDSKYLSFNYTLTLENVYQIPPANICYIHERINSKSKLIVGHNLQRTIENLPAKSDEEEKAQAMFVEIINGLVKPKEQQMEKHHAFFDSLRNIDRIIVIGHSMAKVDLGYFGEVKRSVMEGAKWYFSKYTPDDIQKTMVFIKPAKLQSNFIKDYDFFDLSNI